ncbi:MAG: twin-arginine translocase subunit TatC [Legionellaceae bacterium]
MLHHLIELRRRLLRVAAFFFIFFALFFFFRLPVFQMIVAPLIRAFPLGGSLITTQMTGPLLVPLRLAFDLALLCSAVVLLIELWAFSVPGLYRHERHEGLVFLSASLILFVLGVMFCFYGLLPFFFELMIHATPQGVLFMPDITSVMDFILILLLVFGLCFQVPLLAVVMVRFHWVSLVTLQNVRPYVIVLAFILGMLLTPPDVLSQIIVAIPLWFLYELGILCVRVFR